MQAANICLESFVFLNSGKDLMIRFCSSYDGRSIGFIHCKNVSHFLYQNSFIEDDEDDNAFGCFICDLYLRKAVEDDPTGFPLKDNCSINTNEYFLKLESGQIFMQVRFSKIEQNFFESLDF